MKSLISHHTILAFFALAHPASAVVNIEWVIVGNPGNADDTRVMVDNTTGYGSVSYAYQIGKYEVTNSQYAAFLNAKGGSNSNGIYNASMASYGIAQGGSPGSYSYSVTSGFENKPVVYVSWYDAARFTNWLGNGQGSGDAENGAYTLNGATSGIVTVNPGATIYLPSENEWYKAAYYNGDTSSYSIYPNGRNLITAADANYESGGSANVGSYSGDSSFYGTFDQGGNVWEWNDAVISTLHGDRRGERGGSWAYGGYALQSSYRNLNGAPFDETNDFGFRVASVPEPTSVVLTILFSAGLLARRKR